MTDEQSRILIETEQRSKSNLHRINEMSDELKEVRDKHEALYEMAASIKIIAQRVDSIGVKVDDTNHKVEDTNAKVDAWTERITNIENQPAQSLFTRMNSVKTAIITAILTLLATGAVSKLIDLLSKHP